MKILIDAMGGDHAPEAPVLGAIEAAKTYGSQITLVGRGEDILNAMKQNGIDTLLISEGHVDLPGYSYGFIGGASAKISSNEVFFFGNIEAHRNYNEIHEFLKKHGCTMIYDKKF